jgi:hypothetical protein
VRSRTRVAASPASGRPSGLDLSSRALRTEEPSQASTTAPGAGHRFAGVVVQRKAEEESIKRDEVPAPAERSETKPVDTAAPEPPKPLPVSTDAAGKTTLKQPPLIVHDEYSGATLADVAATLPKEAGSARFDLRTATEGDPITKTTVEVTQEVHLPRWIERDKQSATVQKAWDGFYHALKNHEDGHLAINQSAFEHAHRRYAGSASSATQAITDAIKKEAQQLGDEFDEKTKHGVTGHPPTTLDVTAANDAAQQDEGGQTAQAKLEISEPGDSFELEADRVADRVMRMEDPDGVPAPSIGTQRALAQRKEAGAGVAVPAQAVATARASGQPLDAATRAFMEPRFGFDFSRVRIHADGDAARAARSLDARAYTVGTDVVFGAGRFSPHSPEGRRLLAHELTHVVQQHAGTDGMPSPRRTPTTIDRRFKSNT